MPTVTRKKSKKAAARSKHAAISEQEAKDLTELIQALPPAELEHLRKRIPDEVRRRRSKFARLAFGGLGITQLLRTLLTRGQEYSFALPRLSAGGRTAVAPILGCLPDQLTAKRVDELGADQLARLLLVLEFDLESDLDVNSVVNAQELREPGWCLAQLSDALGLDEKKLWQQACEIDPVAKPKATPGPAASAKPKGAARRGAGKPGAAGKKSARRSTVSPNQAFAVAPTPEDDDPLFPGSGPKGNKGGRKRGKSSRRAATPPAGPTGPSEQFVARGQNAQAAVDQATTPPLFALAQRLGFSFTKALKSLPATPAGLLDIDALSQGGITTLGDVRSVLIAGDTLADVVEGRLQGIAAANCLRAYFGALAGPHEMRLQWAVEGRSIHTRWCADSAAAEAGIWVVRTEGGICCLTPTSPLCPLLDQLPDCSAESIEGIEFPSEFEARRFAEQLEAELLADGARQRKRVA